MNKMKIAIYSQKYKADYKEVLWLILQNLQQHNDIIYVEENLWNDFSKKNNFAYPVKTFASVQDLSSNFDAMLTVGGDGTILRAVTYILNLGIPILGINAGRLGFLATVVRSEIQEMFLCLRQKKYTIHERTLLQVLTENQEPIAPMNFALNEVTVVRKNTTSMVTIETSLSGEYLTSYWADGLIIATPTGSTGYSLSCGGPVMMPTSGCFVLTPIAPHNLNARPLIIPDNLEVSLSVNSREKHYFVSFDARLKSIPCKTKIIVKKADFPLRMIELGGHDFFKTLRNKLLWGEDTRN